MTVEPTRLELGDAGWLTCTTELDLIACSDEDWRYLDDLRRTLRRRHALAAHGPITPGAHVVATSIDRGETCLVCGADLDGELPPYSTCPGPPP